MCFWDTEIYMLPFYVFTDPLSARSLLMYRYHTLDAARRKAEALGEAGAGLRHVVKAVVYVLDMADAHHVAPAHSETFGAARPASTLVQVAALTPAKALVEIEVTAIIHD